MCINFVLLLVQPACIVWSWNVFDLKRVISWGFGQRCICMVVCLHSTLRCLRVWCCRAAVHAVNAEVDVVCCDCSFCLSSCYQSFCRLIFVKIVVSDYPVVVITCTQFNILQQHKCKATSKHKLTWHKCWISLNKIWLIGVCWMLNTTRGNS